MSTKPKKSYAAAASATDSKSATPGKVKSNKAAKHEFDRAVRELEKEKKAYQTPKQQKMTFMGIAGWVCASPLYLYGSGIFEASLSENMAVFGVSTLIAAAIIFHMYEVLASQVRHKLLVEKTTSAEGKISSDEEESVVSESANYSLFVINLLYVLFFLLFIGYFLPPYELSHPMTFAAGSILSSLIIATLVSIKLLR